MKVTSRNIFTLPDGSHSLGNNLFLRVRGKSRIFVFRYMLDGKRKDKSLGSASTLNISGARAMAEKFKVSLQDGQLLLTPKEKLVQKLREMEKAKEEEKSKEPVFSEYATRVIEKIASIRLWKNAKHRAQCYPRYKPMPFPLLVQKGYRKSRVKTFSTSSIRYG